MITTLSGGNALLLQAAYIKQRTDFVNIYGDLSLERYDAGDTPYPRLREAVQAMPFLVDKRLVVIDSPTSNKELAEHIAEFLDGVQDSTDVIFIESKFDKRSVLYKTLHKKTEFQDFADLNEAQLVGWLTDYAKEQGGTLSPANARLLVLRLGVDQMLLKNELDKLLSFDKEVNKESIELLTTASAQSTTFDLLDAALAGKTRRALELYLDQRRQRVEPQAILALLGWQLHVLATVKAGGDRSSDQVAKDARLNPYVVRKSAALARRLSMTTIKELVSATYNLDRRLKRESIDADEAMQNLLTSIALS